MTGREPETSNERLARAYREQFMSNQPLAADYVRSYGTPWNPKDRYQ